jgi:hypothetical protein
LILGQKFSYQSNAIITKLIPTHGPVTGKTEVLVLGKGFVASSLLSCQFGQSAYGAQMVVSASYFVNQSAIICTSPANLKFPTALSVQVANNGVFDSTVKQSGVEFTYDPVVQIIQLDPSSGPVSGNMTVRVIGGPFVNSTELRCKFGAIAVQAFYVTDGVIQCFAPPHPPGMYPVEVSLNDQDFTVSRIPFFYYVDPALSRISPVSGPAVSAGTKVNVYGSGFVNSSFLTCRFGGTTCQGKFVSSNYIICPAPQLDIEASGGMNYEALSEIYNRNPDPVNAASYSGRDRSKLFPSAYFYPLYKSRLVTVEVSNNNQDFTNSGINYLYQQDAEIDSILPNSGQVSQQTPIAVRGNNFVNSSTLRCRIGDYISVPTFLAPNLVLCFTPKIPLTSYSQGYVSDRTTLSADRPEARVTDTAPFQFVSNIVYVEVSNNGQDYTNNRKTFTFNIKCSAGYYCPQLNALPCPLGTFCAGEFNSNYTLCPAGTYNPLLAQAEVIFIQES